MSGLLRFRVGSLAQVPLEQLRKRGVRALLLDLDNTLCDPRGDELSGEAVAFWQRAQADGFAGYVLSNGPRGRAERLSAKIGLSCVSRAGKPLRLSYLRALGELGLPKEAVAAVGDQFLTDALGAISMGISLVLVEPRFARDKPLVVLARPLDRLLRCLIPTGIPDRDLQRE